MNKYLVTLGLFFFMLGGVLSAPTAFAAWQPTLRVGLLTGQSSVILTAQGVSADLVSDQQTEPVKNIGMGRSLTIERDGSSFVLDGRRIPGQTLTLRAANPKQAEFLYVEVNGRPYRGEVELSLRGNGMTVVNVVRTEDYVRGTAPEEMPPTWPRAAVEAQAVATRTFALKSRGRHKGEGFDICTTTHCQVYKGMRSEQAETNRAVDATYGQVLEYQGKLIDALFHTDSGGMTENSEDVWGSRVPYLRAATEVQQRTQSWSKDIPASTLVQHFQRKGKIGTLKEIRLSPLAFGKASADRTVSGRVKKLQLVGSQGSVQVTGDELRNAFGLRSTLFAVRLSQGVVHIIGYGWGHGLGLSQWGAKAWAAQLDYKGILAHYYQGTQLVPLYKK